MKQSRPFGPVSFSLLALIWGAAAALWIKDIREDRQAFDQVQRLAEARMASLPQNP